MVITNKLYNLVRIEGIPLITRFKTLQQQENQQGE